MVNVVAVRTEGVSAPITARNISFSITASNQSVRNFAPDLSARDRFAGRQLADNQSGRREVEAAALEFAYEIYDGDKLLIVGYDSNAEIVSDWTDDAKKIERR